MNKSKEKSEQIWEKGWDGHEKAQLLRMMKMPFIEKIKWLEQAQKTVESLKSKKMH